MFEEIYDNETTGFFESQKFAILNYKTNKMK